MSERNGRNADAHLPRLRFPEFADAGAWEPKRLGDVAYESFSGGTPETSAKELFYDGSIPFIRSAEIGKESTELYLTELGLNNSSAQLVNKGDILIALYGANSGNVALAKLNGAINQAVLCLRSKHSNVFIYQLMSVAKDSIVSKYTQGGQGNLSGALVKSIKLPFPSLPEQRRIADCLSSVDALIDAERRTLTALTAHKQGLLQQLFPAEGETTPRLRFPEFADAGAWEQKRLGDYCSITTGKLNANAMVADGQYRFYTCAKDYYFINDYAFDTDALLISGNGAHVGYIHHYKGKFNAYQRTYILDNFSTNIFFIKYYLNRNLYKRILTEKKDGNTPYIVLSTLADMNILLPKDAEEQRRIADCLSSVDALIDAKQRTLTALTAHKKGLLQQLFPASAEEA